MAGIFPGENTKQVRILSTGEVEKDINIAVVTPNARTAGYVSPAHGVAAVRMHAGTGDGRRQVCDPGSESS